MTQVKRPYVLLGEQIDYLIHAFSLKKRWLLGKTMAEIGTRTGYSEDTVYRWRQGRQRPLDETLEDLARMGRLEACLERKWGEQLFRGAGHPDLLGLVDKIWGPKEVKSIPHNLPRREHTEFIGRHQELNRLYELLEPGRGAQMITVDGIGGVGKTALVLEAAHFCLEVSSGQRTDPRALHFDAIIFVSAKQQYLTADRILPRSRVQYTLRDIFREIAFVLERLDITHAAPSEQPELVRRALSRQRTLLIVDNLETVEDRQGVLAFLYDLPPEVKVLITTRERPWYTPIQLMELPFEDGIHLIRHEAQVKAVTLQESEISLLYNQTGGVPAAIVYAVGQLAAGHRFENILRCLADHNGDVARFCFQESVTSLNGQPAHQLLMAIAIFPRPPFCNTAFHVAGLSHDPIVADRAAVQLRQLSLIRLRENQWFTMLPLTREYTLAELAAYTGFERSTRERWVEWYLNFATEYGGADWKEWHIRYDHLEAEWENLLAAVDWCVAHERYQEVLRFWQQLNGFTRIYGYWDDRLTLLGWLIQAAERRGDWATSVEAMYQKAWTLLVMGHPDQLDEAETLLKQAWNLRDQVKPEMQSYAADYLAEYYNRRKLYGEALQWLDTSQKLLEQLNLAELFSARKHANTLYCQAMIYKDMGNYDLAAEMFRQVIELCQGIDWLRIRFYAQNWLADLAIDQGNYAEAKHLLQTGLPVVVRNKDQRAIAFYKRSFARLEQKLNNLGETRQWSHEALDAFERLGMRPEAEEMQAFLQTLDA